MSEINVISDEVKALMRDGKIPFYRQEGGANEIGTIKLEPSMFQNLMDAINSVYGWSSEKPSTLNIFFDGQLLPSDEFMKSQGWMDDDGHITSKGLYSIIKRHYGIVFATHLYGSPAKAMDGEYSEHTVVYESLNVEGGGLLNSENLPEGEKWLARVSRYYLFTERGMQIQHQVPPTVVINPLIAEADREILYRSLTEPLSITVHTAESM